MISRTLSMAGRMTGRVIQRRVVQVLDPAVMEASSREGSMERKAADIRRKTMG